MENNSNEGKSPRTVGDIIEAVQEGQAVTDEEMRLTLLALYYSLVLASPSDHANKPLWWFQGLARDNFARRFSLMKQDPRRYLGERYTPGAEENKKGRAQSKRVLAAFEKRRPVK